MFLSRGSPEEAHFEVEVEGAIELLPLALVVCDGQVDDPQYLHQLGATVSFEIQSSRSLVAKSGPHGKRRWGCSGVL